MEPDQEPVSLDPAEPAVPEAEPTDPAEPANPAPAATAKTKDTRLVTVATLTAQVRAAEAKAKADERARLDQQAQGLGYRNHEDMILKLKNRRQPATAAARRGTASGAPDAEDPAADPDQVPEEGTEAQPAKKPSPRQERRLDLENQRLQTALDKATRAKNLAERGKLELRRKLDETEAELVLRTEAVRAGVQDVDYAIHLLRRTMASMGEKELGSFDEVEFFSKTLRNKHPHLYAVETAPAHTDPQNAPAPAPAKPAESPAPVEAEVKDVRKLSPQEFNENLRRRGLVPPGLGLAG